MSRERREKQRLFIAAEIPDELKDSLQEKTASIRDRSRGIRWVKPQGIHLTFQFLGDTPVTKIEKLSKALTEACSECQSFEVHFGPVGCFPNARRARVLWVGLRFEQPEMDKLQERIIRATSKLGFKKENRKFHPHLTLGRVKNPSQAMNYVSEFLELKEIETPHFSIDKVVLYRSVLKPAGAEYHVVHSSNLSVQGE